MEEVLLPKTVTPVRYELELKPDLEAFKFEGKERVEVKVHDPVQEISLHSLDLTIHSASISLAGSAEAVTATVTLDVPRQRAVLRFPNVLPTGTAFLSITFSGILNTNLCGFYRSKYMLEGKERYMAVTQFEATDARRAFPCWDEPALKASFQVTVVAPKDKVVVSNMPEEERKDAGAGLVSVKFGDSPVMSTYLLAVIVGDFDFVEGTSEEGTLVRVYTPKGKADQGATPLQITLQTLSFYNKHFGIPYPLPKLDLLAIPDFAAGAMENWGAITYRDMRLLFDPKNTTTATKQANMKTINHEIAHMWFGNLVTMKWWTDLWLNEGFARYTEHVPIAKFYPEYDIWTQFVASALITALELDSLRTSHPIEVDVKHPEEINEIFDSISYAKGASVIRMLVAFLGEETFNKGIQAYLKKHLYGNAVTEDLWKSLESVSGQPVGTIMRTWTRQTGYPVLHIKRVPGKKQLEITQSRFLATGAPTPEEESLWMIPVSIATPHSTTKHLMQTRTITVDIDAADNEWVKLNASQTGFYRVNYPSDMLSQLVEPIASKTFSASDRLGIINDALSIAKSGLVPVTSFLSLIKAYQHEDDYSVFSTLSAGLQEILDLISEKPYEPQFRKFLVEFFLPFGKRLGWTPSPNESHLLQLFRASAIGSLVNVAEEQTLEEGCKRFDAFLESPTSLPPDLRFAAYKSVAKKRGRQGFEALLKLFREADASEERVRCLRALGWCHASILPEVLDLALSDKVRNQDCVFLVANVGSNREGRALVWQWLQDNWIAIHGRFGVGQNFLISGIISYTVGYFTDEAKAKEVTDFFAKNPCPTATKSIQQTVEKVISNARWLLRDSDHIQDWLSSLN